MGLYWAYLGPAPVPPLRRLDVSAYPIDNIVEMAYTANWVQVVENHVDSTHIFILHQDTAGGGTTARGTTRGIIDQLTALDYEVLEFGIKRNIVPEAGSRAAEDDLLVFPNMLRRVNQVQIHVPIDDTHTRTFKLHFWYKRDGYDPDADQEPVDYYVIQAGQGKGGAGAHPEVRYFMDQLTGQDVMAIETQGGIAPRTDWRVATGDRGVVLFDRMLLREMDRVQEGLDPFGVVRDPNQVIDTNFEFFQQLVGRLGQPYARQGIQDPSSGPYLHGGANVSQQYARRGPPAHARMVGEATANA
jgi:5,5'-dehydrodivanillate O-demethylase